MDNIATLTSLAMLKVNSDLGGKDYVDYFLPFIGFVLNRRRPNPVTAAAVQALLHDEFRLRVPQYPTEYALHRLADQKYLQKGGIQLSHSQRGAHQRHRSAARVPSPTTPDSHREAERIWGSGSKIKSTDSDAANALLSYPATVLD